MQLRFILLATWWTAAGGRMMERGGPGAVAFVPGPCSVPCAPRASAVSFLGRGRAREWPSAASVPRMRVREEESALASRGYKIWYSVSTRLYQRSPKPAYTHPLCMRIVAARAHSFERERERERECLCVCMQVQMCLQVYNMCLRSVRACLCVAVCVNARARGGSLVERRRGLGMGN
jgi:hypothetical protein